MMYEIYDLVKPLLFLDVIPITLSGVALYIALTDARRMGKERRRQEYRSRYLNEHGPQMMFELTPDGIVHRKPWLK